MNRLDKTIATLRNQGRKALVTFTMAGDPDEKTSLTLFEKLAQHADIIEIGVPFSDPMADGPAVQSAGLRALSHGMDLKKTLALVQQFRSKNNDTPIILMGYFNPIFNYGIPKFMKDCNNLGVDGLIIVDIPPEETPEILPDMQQNNVALICLVTPTTDAARLQKILPAASGFLYYVSIAGVTGTASADPVKVGKHIAEIKQHTDLPVIAGFGIRTPEDAQSMAKIADGVVVGSALVQTIEAFEKDPTLTDRLEAQAAALAHAVHTA